MVINGFINVNKPAGITSHDVVYRMRKWTKIKRIGHAGTLDPDATGVLPLAIGSACRLISYLSSDKIYLAEVLLGLKTTTNDLSGAVTEQNELANHIDQSTVRLALQDFIGFIEQKPPLYSAVHHKGSRLHKLARATQANYLRKSTTDDQDNGTITEAMENILCDLPTRKVKVESIDVLTMQLPIIKLRIVCSSGTYIRSIARDLGQALGCGACLKSLHREKSGPFVIERSFDLLVLEHLIQNRRLPEILIDPAQVLGWKVIEVDVMVAKLISQGRFLPLESVVIEDPANRKENEAWLKEPILIVCKQEDVADGPDIPVALCRISEDQLIKPELVLTNPEDLPIKLSLLTR